MPISMDSTARYVTQSRVWSSPFTGKLTDAKIRRYMRRGYYGKALQARATARSEKVSRQKILQTLCGKYA